MIVIGPTAKVLPTSTVAIPQVAMAQAGSWASASRNACSPAMNAKEWSSATPRSKLSWASGAHELAKATVPSLFGGAASSCARAGGGAPSSASSKKPMSALRVMAASTRFAKLPRGARPVTLPDFAVPQFLPLISAANAAAICLLPPSLVIALASLPSGSMR
jgi:hypothetical protein